MTKTSKLFITVLSGIGNDTEEPRQLRRRGTVSYRGSTGSTVRGRQGRSRVVEGGKRDSDRSTDEGDGEERDSDRSTDEGGGEERNSDLSTDDGDGLRSMEIEEDALLPMEIEREAAQVNPPEIVEVAMEEAATAALRCMYGGDESLFVADDSYLGDDGHLVAGEDYFSMAFGERFGTGSDHGPDYGELEPASPVPDADPTQSSWILIGQQHQETLGQPPTVQSDITAMDISDFQQNAEGMATAPTEAIDIQEIAEALLQPGDFVRATDGTDSSVRQDSSHNLAELFEVFINAIRGPPYRLPHQPSLKIMRKSELEDFFQPVVLGSPLSPELMHTLLYSALPSSIEIVGIHSPISIGNYVNEMPEESKIAAVVHDGASLWLVLANSGNTRTVIVIAPPERKGFTQSLQSNLQEWKVLQYNVSILSPVQSGELTAISQRISGKDGNIRYFLFIWLKSSLASKLRRYQMKTNYG